MTCLAIPAIGAIGGAVACPVTVNAAASCDSTAKNTTCDAAGGYVAEIVKCAQGSWMDHVYTGKCLCADPSATQAMVGGNYTCVSPCPVCPCNVVVSSDVFTCGPNYGATMMNLCDISAPPNAVVHGAYCCPPFVAPAKSCWAGGALGPVPY